VLVSEGLSAGEQLILSDITAPIPGMDVSTGAHAEAPGAEDTGLSALH
jgi:hypothetical protein